MSLLKTPADLGNVIRHRRKALGWDQARLAQETGVSRQWIIEIEKGKPRAELQLVLRTLNVLGIELDASPRQTSAPSTTSTPALPLPDINRIVQESRAPTSGISALLERQRKLMQPFDTATATMEKIGRSLQPLGGVLAAFEQQRKLMQPLGNAMSSFEQARKLAQPFGSASTFVDEQARLARLMENAASYPAVPEEAPAQQPDDTGTARATPRQADRKRKPRKAKPPKAPEGEGK